MSNKRTKEINYVYQFKKVIEHLLISNDLNSPTVISDFKEELEKDNCFSEQEIKEIVVLGNKLIELYTIL